jgi:hypothetical protein
MSYIGNTPTSIPFITDTFSGNASATSFTPLTRAPASTASIAVFISGTYQPPSAYTLSGVTITFATAPPNAVGNIVVLHLGTGSTTQVPSDGSVTLSKLYSDTYGYINAAFTTANTPSYVANSAASYANAAFATANTGTASGSYANSAFATANTVTSASSYANSAFSVANNGVGIDATQNTNITNAGTYANTGFAVANSAALYANSAFSKANGVVTSAVAGTGVSVSAATGAVTFTNSGVTSIVAGSGISISGGTGAVTVTNSAQGATYSAGAGISLSGTTFSQDIYTGSSQSNTSFPIGSYLYCVGGVPPSNQAAAVKVFYPNNYFGSFTVTNASGAGIAALSGTWRARGTVGDCASGAGIVQRTA